MFLNPDDLGVFLRARLVTPEIANVILGEGIDTDQFRPTPEPDGVPTVLVAARMLRDKGIGTLIEAARLLRARRVPVKIVLAGSPDPSNPSSIPQALLKEWTREGLVDWIGYTDNIQDLLASTHIACLPSLREGVPTSLLEAAACGKPIVATNVPGCREVVVHGRNGFLVPPGAPDALAQALEDLAGNAGLRCTMGERSRQLALERFAIEHISQRVLAIYEDLLSKHV